MTQFVRRRPGERYKKDCLHQVVKHPPSLMIWSCISSEGPGPIYFVDGTMRQQQYKYVLSDVLLPYINSLPYVRTYYTFMQDGAPCHTARTIANFLEEEYMDVLPWPGNSPDLNPIENCWAYLKSKVYSRPNPNIHVLKENIKDIWNNDEELKASIISCISSMPRRIQKVIKNKGNCLDY